MNTLQPLTQHELQRQASKAACHGSRLFVAAVLLIVLASIYGYVLATLGNAAGVGGSMLTGVVALNYLLITVTAAPLFATAVTEEREAETLPLLVVSGLPLRSIVLGKWSSRLIPIVLMLGVQCPLIIGSFGFGGFGLSQLMPSLILLFSYTFLLAGLGLLASTLALSSSQSQLAVMLPVLLVEFAGRAATWALANIRFRSDAFSRWVQSTVEGIASTRVASTFESLYDIQLAAGAPPWRSLAVAHGLIGLAAVGLALAVAEPWLQRTFRYRPRVRLRLTGRDSRRLRGDAIFAREFRFAIGGVKSLVARLVIHLVVAAGVYAVARWMEPNQSERRLTETVLFAPVVLTAIDFWLHAGRLLAVEIRDRTLPMIVLSAARMPAIVFRKLAAASMVLLPGLAVLLLTAATLPHGLENLRSAFRSVTSGDSLITVAAVMQVFCLAHLTMLLSLRRPYQAYALATASWVVGNIVLLLVAALLSFVVSAMSTASLSEISLELSIAQSWTYLTGLALIGLHVATVLHAETVAGE